MTNTRRPRGNYYATAHERRDGKTYGVQVARQAKTLGEACARLDARNADGYVQLWSDRTQQRTIVAERDQLGQWWARNLFNGTNEPFIPPKPKEAR